MQVACPGIKNKPMLFPSSGWMIVSQVLFWCVVERIDGREGQRGCWTGQGGYPRRVLLFPHLLPCLSFPPSRLMTRRSHCLWFHPVSGVDRLHGPVWSCLLGWAVSVRAGGRHECSAGVPPLLVHRSVWCSHGPLDGARGAFSYQGRRGFRG